MFRNQAVRPVLSSVWFLLEETTMTIARKQIVAEDQIRNYHCTTRCVRRAFLCGLDFLTGRNYEHRRLWIKERLVFLSGIFAVDVVGYSVQSNHLHVILRTRPDSAKSLSDQEVATRWLRLFPPIDFKDESDWIPSEALIFAVARDATRMEICRHRLTDLSWFMRCLDERIARLANREDQCKGHFWEGRFRCKLLLDEAALLTCMAYIDLNPIRAGETQTPEESRLTSAYDRINAFRADTMMERVEKTTEVVPEETPVPNTALFEEHQAADWLCPLNDTADRKGVFRTISTKEYLFILDILGREVQPGKKGSIPPSLEPILKRVSIDSACWLDTLDGYDGIFRRILGRADRVMEQAKEAGLKWFQGVRACRQVFGC